ncbi:MAG: hypothetical protein ACYTG2_07610 [Planctomycetota bacterium]|jgi:glutamyl-tRNA reductase
MERIAVAGLTLHGTDVSGLERARRPQAGHEAGFLRGLADDLGASELVLLATCNRVEIVFAREEGDLRRRTTSGRCASCCCCARGATLRGTCSAWRLRSTRS